jgi:septum formation protein
MKELLLGSTSRPRQILLEDALIPFVVVGHDANEDDIEHTTLEETVLNIARLKMQHVYMPADKQEGEVIFVLTADSMGCTVDGVIQGKPKDRADAIAKIKSLSGESSTCTGFCIEKRVFKNGVWTTEKKIENMVSARCKFEVPDAWIDRYLENSWSLKAAGAIAIELYGAQFLQWVDGSFTAVMGLPMFEVRQALEEVGFFN